MTAEASKNGAGPKTGTEVEYGTSGGDMFRNMLIGAATAGVLAFGTPAATFAQPPSPPEIVRKVDNGVRHVVKKTHRAVTHADRHARHEVRKHAPRATRRTVRAKCNDGRIHSGRTRVTACIDHGGLRG
jgi:hypothetical protein